MSSKEIILKGTVRKGQFLFKRKKLAQRIIDGLEGKEFEMVLSEEEPDKSTSQLGYYFGGIIRNTCMKTELFAGWEFDEIDDFFRKRFLSYKKELVRYLRIKDSPRRRKLVVSAKVTERLESLSRYKMRIFLEKVIMFLATEKIYPLDPNEYKLKRYSQIQK